VIYEFFPERDLTASADSSSSTHSSHHRLIGRGEPGMSSDLENVQFLCDLFQENSRSTNDRFKD
jgi:hypothetical protein